MNTLDAIVSSATGVILDQSIEDYPILVVKNSACEAKVALHGAHLFEWTPTGQQAVIYNSPDSIYREGKAIRGGVPVCWPWFNAHPTDSSLPSHGIARNRFWSLISAEASSDDATILIFELKSNEETKAIWSYDFEAKVTISLGPEVSVALQTLNTGDQEITVGGALHTYLSVGDISAVSIAGLDAVKYLDTVGERTERKQNGGITISEEVDRIYQDTSGTITLYDSSLGREIEVDRGGSTTAVVWNPWLEKAKALGDLPDEAYTDFVCIEAANALKDVYVLQSGEEHTLSTTIRVS